MRYDIIFHLTTEEEYQNSKENGYFEPAILQEEGFIPCAGGTQVEALANSLFSGKDKILLLVIDVSTLQHEVKYEYKDTEEKYPNVYGSLNVDAIIDKIPIQSEKGGDFKISFESFS